MAAKLVVSDSHLAPGRGTGATRMRILQFIQMPAIGLPIRSCRIGGIFQPAAGLWVTADLPGFAWDDGKRIVEHGEAAPLSSAAVRASIHQQMRAADA